MSKHRFISSCSPSAYPCQDGIGSVAPMLLKAYGDSITPRDGDWLAIVIKNVGRGGDKDFEGQLLSQECLLRDCQEGCIEQ